MLNKVKAHIERRIARKLLSDVIAAGYWVSIDNEIVNVRPSNSVKKLLEELFQTDQDCLCFHRTGDSKTPAVGWVILQPGNVFDLIVDYSVNSETLVAGANALAAKLEAKLN